MSYFKFILILIIISLISFGIGAYYGANKVIGEAVDIALRLVELKKINIDIDENMIKRGIMQYYNNIGDCLFLQDEIEVFQNTTVESLLR